MYYSNFGLLFYVWRIMFMAINLYYLVGSVGSWLVLYDGKIECNLKCSSSQISIVSQLYLIKSQTVYTLKGT